MNNDRQAIDTLRGFACILLVAYHVVGNTPFNGLRLEEGVYRELNDLLGYVRMPIFTFLSGLVYAYRPFNGDYRKFFSGKTRRLLFPMLVVGACFAVLQSFTPGANAEQYNWSTLHVLPVAHFWFVEALFIIFAFVAIFEALKFLSNPLLFSAVFGLATFVYTSSFDVPYFALSGAVYLFPFFLLGVAIHRFNLIRYLSVWHGWMLLILVSASLMLNALGYLYVHDKRSVYGLLVGAVFCIGALSVRGRSQWLARIGAYSYSIYLFHVFFTAAFRIILTKVGVENTHLLFAVSLLAGIIGPIVAERLLLGTNITRVLCLGKAPTKIENLWFSKRFKKDRELTTVSDV
ncbi:putative Acyltransferase 3 [Vibrio nigripulchritudo MADA3029]|uniref:acyltransferase family protein n=1 Tax=Vibrio nigripulchritudo TaxID=28173 RepID=UPI0003B22247|nr:acyltransferase [Vibrio nigripulchritudo]CCN49201.1 putative Acyltransferase 3 [Vibrio nigripulchritudo MADA3020]CCN54186.1 putative Acyltransferase 3 [Vibrio nigripulchritudo MADA3021]CCN61256.1 putative Acyltransferase 3 [Vibrio nigripulchritudo MADA3029]